MNREDVAMDLTFENLDILRKEVQAAKLLLSECDKVLEEDGGVYIELRAFLSGKMDADEVIELLDPPAEQRNQCDGCQAGIPLVDGAHSMGRPGGYPDLMSCQKERYKHPEQAEGAQGEREAFEAHESRERRLSPADQKFWFRRGAVADYDIKSIDDAWKAWKARAALAQPALQCKKCGGTGDADSGGIHPWGEAAMVPCDCAHTERAQGKRTEDGDTIIDRLRLGGLTIDGDNAYKRDLLDCVVGALAFGFQGRPAPEETHWLHRFWEIGNAEREARAALAQPSPKPKPRLVECDACPTSGGCVEVCMKAPAQPSPARQVVMKEICPSCEHQFVSHHNGYINRLRGVQQPSPAPELERPEVVAFLNEWRDRDQGGIRVTPALSAMSEEGLKKEYAPLASVVRREPLMTVSQHDRIGMQWASLVHRAQAKADAAKARIAELEKQEPVAWAVFSDNGNVICWSQRRDHVSLITLESDGRKVVPLYAAPAAQVPEVRHKQPWLPRPARPMRLRRLQGR